MAVVNMELYSIALEILSFLIAIVMSVYDFNLKTALRQQFRPI